MSHSAQALVWSTALGKGTYALTPTFSLDVPVNADRSNFSGTPDASPENPYVAVLTFTLA